MKKIAEFDFHPIIWTLASEIGKIRTDRNAQTRKNNPKYDHGNRNYSIDQNGMIGELLCIWYCMENTDKFACNVAPLLAWNPVSEPDIIVHSLSETKSWRIDAKWFNEKPTVAMKDDKKLIDHYWFATVTNYERNKAAIWSMPNKEVTKWTKRTDRSGKQYYEGPVLVQKSKKTQPNKPRKL